MIKMFRVLLFTLGLGVCADQTFIRREATSNQGRQNGVIMGAEGNILSKLVEKMKMPPTDAPLPGSPTFVTVFITGDSGKQLASGNDGQSIYFTDAWDETAQWKLEDDGSGRVRVQSISQQTYLTDTGFNPVQSDTPSFWTLETTARGMHKLKSRNKYLLDCHWCGTGGTAEIKDNDGGAGFSFNLYLKQVAWGNSLSSAKLKVYMIGPNQGKLKEEPGGDLHLEGSFDASSLFTLSCTGDGNMFIKGPNNDYMADNEGLEMKVMDDDHADNADNQKIFLWNVAYSEEGDGQIIAKSHRDRYLIEDTDGDVKMSDDTTAADLGKKLWMVLIQSINF